jgi:hypothetical protein
VKSKTERAERIREMLKGLAAEQEHEGGFNEFPQFCEEALAELADHLSEEGRQLLIEKIEQTSCLGVTRRSPTAKPGKQRRLYA